MTSYNDLVNFEIGNQSNYGSQFKLSRLESIAAINILKLTGKKRKTSKVMRVYIAGSMGTGNTHLDKFTTGNNT
jgi:ribosome biogenesis protein Tsr3